MADNLIGEKSMMIGGYVEGKSHYLPVRIYYADTDFSGLVYHGRYVEFMERGRTEALRAFGLVDKITQSEQEEALGPFVFAVSALNMRFKAPAHIDDILQVRTTITKLTGARIFIEQKIFKQEQLLIDAECCLVLITEEGRPRRIPDSWRRLMLEA